MSSYRLQSRNGGDGAAPVLPIIVNNNNFAKGAPGAPTLLSFDDARTLFHEFGHGLHGLLSNVTYERVSGTNVLRDFVELPSQLFEHWLEEPEVLKRHARHYRDRRADSRRADRAAASRRATSTRATRRCATPRRRWSTWRCTREPSSEPIDVVAFERAELERLGLPAGVGVNHRLVHFQHLFSGSSYAAGYYVYLWAEVLDADGFDAFVEAGDPFDPAVARRLAPLHLLVGQLDRAGRGVPRLPRPRRRDPSRCSGSAACSSRSRASRRRSLAGRVLGAVARCR